MVELAASLIREAGQRLVEALDFRERRTVRVSDRQRPEDLDDAGSHLGDLGLQPFSFQGLLVALHVELGHIRRGGIKGGGNIVELAAARQLLAAFDAAEVRDRDIGHLEEFGDGQATAVTEAFYLSSELGASCTFIALSLRRLMLEVNARHGHTPGVASSTGTHLVGIDPAQPRVDPDMRPLRMPANALSDDPKVRWPVSV